MTGAIEVEHEGALAAEIEIEIGVARTGYASLAGLNGHELHEGAGGTRFRALGARALHGHTRRCREER